jgi:hypothetical protein
MTEARIKAEYEALAARDAAEAKAQKEEEKAREERMADFKAESERRIREAQEAAPKTEAEKKQRETDARVAFARAYEKQLLDEHLNPDAVTAVDTTLKVRAWFCTRQFLHDFQNGPIAKQAKAIGFKRLECSSPGGLVTGQADL